MSGPRLTPELGTALVGPTRTASYAAYVDPRLRADLERLVEHGLARPVFDPEFEAYSGRPFQEAADQYPYIAPQALEWAAFVAQFHASASKLSKWIDKEGA